MQKFLKGQLCNQEPNCNGWSWHEKLNGQYPNNCWLKHTMANRRGQKHVVSGMKSCPGEISHTWTEIELIQLECTWDPRAP